MAPADLKNEIPGISGTRALNDNLSDMKAQVASNFKGIGLVTALIEEYTLEVVQAYMHHIQVGSPHKFQVTQHSLFVRTGTVKKSSFYTLRVSIEVHYRTEERLRADMQQDLCNLKNHVKHHQS